MYYLGKKYCSMFFGGKNREVQLLQPEPGILRGYSFV